MYPGRSAYAAFLVCGLLNQKGRSLNQHQGIVDQKREIAGQRAPSSAKVDAQLPTTKLAGNRGSRARDCFVSIIEGEASRVKTLQRTKGVDMVSARRGREAPSHTPEPTDQERKERIRAQLVAGERIATCDIQPGEFFVQMHRAILRAMNTAHRLTAGQRQYLGVLIEYSYGYRSPWAIRDMADRRPPSLADWCNWLGGWSSEQVCAVRKQLLDLRVIQFVEQNSSYVALNETWEDWDQDLFSKHEKRTHAGRPAKGNSRINPREEDDLLICEFTSINSRINAVNPQINEHEFVNSPALIREFTDGCHEASPQEGEASAPNKKRNKEEDNTLGRGDHPHNQMLRKEKAGHSLTKTTTLPIPEADLSAKLSAITAKTTESASQQAKGNAEISRAQQLNPTSQATLFPAIAMAAPAQPAGADLHQLPPSRRRSCTTGKSKIPPQNRLYEVWKQILPPATDRQVTRLCTGLAELANPAKTMGYPVTPEELPLLMYQVMDDWVDRTTGEHFTPTPYLLAEWLDKIRRQVQKAPSQQVCAWLDWQRQQRAEAASEAEPGAANKVSHLIEMVRAFEARISENHVADESAAFPGDDDRVVLPAGEPGWAASCEETTANEALEDFSWTARLRRWIPDPDGARNGRHKWEVGMLWGFVRDELRPGFNTARRHHLDALTAAWDPEQPGELLLLSSSAYTVHFIGSALLREIDERVDKLLSRFFDRVKVLTVPQNVIDALREPIRPEGELINTAR